MCLLLGISKKEEKNDKETICCNHSWSPPPSEFLKINTDGSFDEATSTGGWSLIIRNELGDLIAAGSGKPKAFIECSLCCMLLMLHLELDATG